MAKIIKLDPTSKKPKTAKGSSTSCEHKHVIAYTYYRTVCCSRCGAILDPFDVLVDMLKGAPPEDENRQEEKKLNNEVARRRKAKKKDDGSEEGKEE